ncbi:MAG: universal stress protein [Chitinophagales bacterium]
MPHETKATNMHRVIITVDFSDTSMNAARFAAQMLAGNKDALAILYHNYEHAHDRENCISYLESLKKEFLEKGVGTVEYESEMGGDLVDNLERLAHSRHASLVVMGIKGHSSLHDAFMGVNTLKMVEKNICPVMIIPPDATFTDIKNVAFASDFVNIEMTTPTALIRSVLEMFNPFLHIVNVNSEHYVSLTEEYQQGKAAFRELFKGYNMEFYFIGMFDFYEAIDNFIRDYKIDMLLTVPRYHKSAHNLFKISHTKKLAYHSHIPILAAHQ